MNVCIPFPTFHLSTKQESFVQEYTTQQDCKRHITHHTTRHLLPLTAMSQLQSCRTLCGHCELSTLSAVSPSTRPRRSNPPPCATYGKWLCAQTRKSRRLTAQPVPRTSTSDYVEPTLVFFLIFFLPTDSRKAKTCSRSTVVVWAEKEVVDVRRVILYRYRFMRGLHVCIHFLEHNKRQ